LRRLLISAALAAALFSPAVLAPAPAAAYGSCYVWGYTRADGTYVQGHFRSCPDSSTSNNWSAPGNTNPHTGETSRPRYSSGYGSYWP
jgi:hypothetical protein